jgi:hypothetical protein
VSQQCCCREITGAKEAAGAALNWFTGQERKAYFRNEIS